jgi:hypothetical protein
MRTSMHTHTYTETLIGLPWIPEQDPSIPPFSSNTKLGTIEPAYTYAGTTYTYTCKYTYTHANTHTNTHIGVPWTPEQGLSVACPSESPLALLNEIPSCPGKKQDKTTQAVKSSPHIN